MLAGILSHIFWYDVWFYASHVFLHAPSVYAWVHRIHHSTKYLELNYASTHVAHWIENLVQPMGILVPLIATDNVLDTRVIVALSTSIVILHTRGLLRHDHRCSRWIGNHHLLHHKYPKYNYGEYWIDWFCGTLCPHADEYIYGHLYT